MSYQPNSCDNCWKSSNQNPVQCKSCTDADIVRSGDYIATMQEAKQRKIWNVARVPSSLFVMNKAVQNVTGDATNQPIAQYGFVNWNQASDRNRPGVSTYNTTRNTTRHRPGGSGAGGVGVDIKHNSYDRYLARKKAGNLKTKKASTLPQPQYGNKQYSLGFINRCNC